MHIYIYIYIYIYIRKVQGTVVCPIVFNLFNLAYLSYLIEMYFSLIRDAFINHFPM